MLSEAVDSLEKFTVQLLSQYLCEMAGEAIYDEVRLFEIDRENAKKKKGTVK